jgi:hypothetical protein
MKLHKLKLKKKALQARIAGSVLKKTVDDAADKNSALEDIISAKKRKNPFVKNNENKKTKPDVPSSVEESSDNTLFKLLHQSAANTSLNTTSLTTFENILNKDVDTEVVVVKAKGQTEIPVDWALKSKIRLWSVQPFLGAKN